MAPPAKRRKRNNGYISSSPPSEEDDSPRESKTKARGTIMDLISSSPMPSSDRQNATSSGPASKASPSKPQPRATTANFPPNAAPIYLPKTRMRNGSKSASSSPEKARRKTQVEEKGKSGNIFALFSKQAQRQKAAATKDSNSSKQSTPTQSSKDTELDVLDSISDDDDVFNSLAQSSSFVSQAARKRSRGPQALKNNELDVSTSTQKFVVKSQCSTDSKQEDTRPWAERFAARNLDELAVHKKKVSDVREWFEEVTAGRRRQRVLLLKGAAGTAKTTTVQLLADAMGFEVLEWRNPVGSVDTSDGVQSMTAQFEEFLGRSDKFGQLDVFSEGVMQPKPDQKPLDRRKRLIVVEEFPNTFSRSSSGLQSFRSTILRYLAANMPPLSLGFQSLSKESITPLVLIVSETLLTTTSASADSFTAHRLLGPEILQHPGVGVIEFNPIAPTLLAKALEVIVQKESRRSGRRKTPGPLVLKALGEVGDIRSAIGSLEFLCLRGDVDGDWGARVAFGKTKRGKEQALTKMEEESLELITRREASLGIFHAVAKVAYNKRVETDARTAIPDTEKLPSFLSMQSRPKKSEVDVETLIDETGTDTQTFIAALHENYILSCNAPPTSFDVSSLDHVNGCIEALSDSDLLCPSWDGSFNSTGFGGGTGGRGSGGDILRQDEITFQIAVRGLLFALPNPVIRRAPENGGVRKIRGGDQFKMFYPTSLRLWRTQEDIESSIDLWVTRLMKGEDQHLRPVTAGASAFTKPKMGTVESWKSRSKAASGEDDSSTPLLAVGTSARKEMLLERLPYMLQIARAQRSSQSAKAIKDMEKIVTFHGIGGPADDESDKGEDNGAAGEEWATDKPGEGRSPKKKKPLVLRGRGQTAAVPMQQEQELKLVLSDDDIEDD